MTSDGGVVGGGGSWCSRWHNSSSSVIRFSVDPVHRDAFQGGFRNLSGVAALGASDCVGLPTYRSQFFVESGSYGARIPSPPSPTSQ